MYSRRQIHRQHRIYTCSGHCFQKMGSNALEQDTLIFGAFNGSQPGSSSNRASSRMAVFGSSAQQLKRRTAWRPASFGTLGDRRRAVCRPSQRYIIGSIQKYTRPASAAPTGGAKKVPAAAAFKRRVSIAAHCTSDGRANNYKAIS